MEILFHIHYYQVQHLIFYSAAEFHNLVYFGDSVAVGYRDANDMFVTFFFT
ncbi:MAG: hypothetical protein ACKPKO_21795 [Candidatus Fonsibacter sp.]